MKKSRIRLVSLAITVLFIAAAVNIGVFPASTTFAAGPDEYNLKLMTFNVRNLNGDNGTVNSWDNRKGKAVNAINGSSPDIIGMQEAYKVQIDYFISNLSNSYASIGISRFGNTTNEYSNIMYRTDKFNVLDYGQFWLSETPEVAGSYSSYDNSWPRVCTWAKFQAKDNSKAVFYYFNTHFSLTDEAKQQSANLILDRISKYVTTANIPVFIGGDLNSVETSVAYNILQNSDFEDTWAQAGKSWTDDSTAHGYSGAVNGGHIDWIFHRNGVRINSIDVNHYSENGLYPSDHFPVQLNIDIPLTGEPSPERSSNGTASAQYTDSPSGEDITKAFDNSNKTKYYVPHGTLWLQYRFPSGSKFAVNRYKLTSANDDPVRDPKNWTVKGSNNGTTWTTIDTRSNESFPARYQVKEYKCGNTTPYEYIRFEFTSNNGSSFQVADIELYDYVNVAIGGTKTADAYNSGEEPAKGADGHVSTGKWCASGAEPHWLKVDLGAVNNVYQFVVKHAANGGEAADYNTAAYQIQYSNDGASWTNAVSVTGNKANVTTHNVNILGRYLRLYVTDASSRSGDSAARIYEFEAFGRPAGAVFYKDVNYGETAVSLGKGNYTLAQLEEAGMINDSISSLKVFGGCTVELYWDDNFQGSKLTKTEDVSWLGDEWNDKISSIKIY